MEQEFTISSTAAQRIAYLLADEPPGSRLRVAVEGGGCSGFQYHFSFDSAGPGDGDAVFGATDAPVVVDAVSLEFMKGARLDYVENLGAAAFEIKNPVAKSGCGCGNSFAVAL